MEKKGLLIFDFDGVIVDSVALMYQNTKKSLPFLSWGLYQQLFDNKLFLYAIKLYVKLFRKTTPKSLQEKRLKYTSDKLEKTNLVEGIDSVIERLSNEYILTVNTNASVANSVPILEKYGLKKYFVTIKTRDTTDFKAEKNKEILKELNMNGKDALYITDSFRDVLDAKEAGVKSVGVLSGVHKKRHFEQRGVKASVVGIATDTENLYNIITEYFENERK